MYYSTFLQTLLLIATFAPSTFAQNDLPLSGVSDPTKRAQFALSSLQIWYDAGSGLYSSTGWWNSANAMTTLANIAKADKTAQTKDLASRVFANTLVQAPAHNPQPGIEQAKAKTKRRDIDDIMFELEELTGMETGYDKILDNEDELLTIYPQDWRKVSEEYLDVTQLPVYTSSSEKVTVAAADANDWLDGFYDDDLWWALAWIAAYDITEDKEYLTLAKNIFNAVAKTWGTYCGDGGIYWNWKKDYVNAIANELFLSTAAHLANRVEEKEKATYVKWAKMEIEWFTITDMINDRGTINDGLTEECHNNNRTTWSYNQGVILGGLVELNRASPDEYYMELANNFAKAAIAELSDDNGILHDRCGPYCGPDGSQFKGIFVRNLQMLHEAAPDDAYAEFIKANAESIWNNDRDEGNMLSVNWAGPFINPANASTHSSAMDALVAAIAVK